MSEQFNKNKGQRLILPRKIQEKFLLEARDALGLTWTALAKKVAVHTRVMNDWKRAASSLSAPTAYHISKISGIPIPSEAKLKERFWYTSKGGKISGPKVYAKYGHIGGDPEYRIKRWREWWNKNGKNNLGAVAIERKIKTPRKSAKLAEFFGIILGDGGITERQVTVSLDSLTDKKYAIYVAKLFQELFDEIPSMRPYTDSRALGIQVSRTALVRFFSDRGIPSGNKVKRQADIPQWIKDKKTYAIACVRGLMDTDGSIFNECHLIKGKKYCYPRVFFVSHSAPLRESVHAILKETGLEPKLRGNRAVVLDKPADVIRYFECIGTHNPKHAERFVRFTGRSRIEV